MEQAPEQLNRQFQASCTQATDQWHDQYMIALLAI